MVYKDGRNKKKFIVCKDFLELAKAFEAGYWKMGVSKADIAEEIKSATDALEAVRKKEQDARDLKDNRIKAAYEQGFADGVKSAKVKGPNLEPTIHPLLAIPVMDKKLISAFEKAGIKTLEAIPRDMDKLIAISGVGEATARKVLDHFKGGK